MLEQPTLTHSPENPDDELKRLRERVTEQTALIAHLRERIRELEAHLAKDSHNSSRPPSSDSPFKKPPPRSQRQLSGCKPGGQPGRCGVTRSLVDHPDQCGIIPLTGTCACGRCGTGIAATVLAERRQVVEVEIQRKVIEYRIVGGTGACGRAQRSTFPAGIEAPDAFGLLVPFAGVLVHDHGSACQHYSCWQAFCNAHHLRKLTAIAERSPSQPWATDMIALLCQANALVGKAQDQNRLCSH